MNAVLRLVDSPAWSIAGWSLLHYLWIGAVLGIAAWLLRRAVGPLSPQARYAAAAATFAALAIAPPLIAWRVATHRIGESPAAIAPLAAAVEQPLPLDPAAQARLASAPTLPASTLRPLQPAVPPVESIEEFLSRQGSNVLAVAVRWAPAGWLFGMPLTFALLATGLFGAERLRRRSSPLVDGPIADAVRRWSEALRITRTVAVGVSDRVVAPLVIGVLRPMIVLPAAIVARQSPEQMEMILLHELSHVRRADNLVNLIQRVVEAVLFFQPAVWFVSRWVRLEREHCCDSMVLSYTGDPQGYAETLASLAMPGISPAYAAAAMANHQLVSRIQHILSREEQTMSLSPRIVAIAGAICLVIGLSLSGAAQQTSGVEAQPAAVDNATAAAQQEPAAKVANAQGERAMAIDGPAEGSAFYLGEYATAVDDGRKAGSNAPSSDATSTGTNGTVDARVSMNGKAGVTGVTDVTVYRNLAADTTASGKRPWGPEQATGAPDVPNGGDDERAWAALTQDDQDEWLELTYAEPVEVIAVQVFANSCPGAVSRVTVFDANTAGLQYTWQGEDPVKASGPRALGVSIISIPAPITTNRIRVELASKSVAGWNEIDAVGLLAANGKTHWATGATASSTYAERATAGQIRVFDETPRLQYRRAVAEVQRAHDAASVANALAQIAGRNGRRQLDGRDWSPDQAAGAPADLSVADANDHRHAWRPAQADAGRETVTVVYAEPVRAKLLLVYELGPAATVEISVRNDAGAETRVLAERNLASATPSTVLSVPLDGKNAISAVTLGLDTKAHPGFTDIDAVGLIDAEGKVHWADSANATSTHADLADQATKASRLDMRWLHRHGQEKVNASCVKCHQTSQDHGDSKATHRVPVKDLLEMSDGELREWLQRQGAANVHIDAGEGTAVVQGAAGKLFDALQGGGERKPRAPHANERSQATPNSGAAAEIDASPENYYQRAFEAQASVAANVPMNNGVGLARTQLKEWILAADGTAADCVEIVLAVGEKGYFSRPDRRIVRAERVEAADATSAIAVTLTGDGLEFVSNTPGTSRLRCWDQQGQMIEISVTVVARPLPRQPVDSPTVPPREPNPRDASRTKAEVGTAIDRLVLDRLEKHDEVLQSSPDGPTIARRAYLDLLGIVPTREQIDRFVGDGSRETIAKSLDALARIAATQEGTQE